MSGPAAVLREIHRLHSHARDLQKRLESEPRQLQVQQDNVTRREESLRQEQEGVKKLKVAIGQNELALKTTLQQVAKYEKQLNEAAGKKEYDALKLEIANARQEVLRLEDAILDGMGQAEERTAGLPALEKALQQAKEEFAKFQRESESRLTELARHREEVLREVEAVEAQLTGDVRELYLRLYSAKGVDALSAVQGQSCVACYTAVTTQNQNELRQNLFVLCKNCGRILFLAE
jgi:predicted  nucleic acid-binding Zn-ribbon protein